MKPAVLYTDPCRGLGAAVAGSWSPWIKRFKCDSLGGMVTSGLVSQNPEGCLVHPPRLQMGETGESMETAG